MLNTLPTGSPANDRAGPQSGPAPALSRLSRRRNLRYVEERIVIWALRAAAIVSVLTTAAIVFVLLRESLGFFFEVSLWDFLTGTSWTPLFQPQHFGVLPLLAGTLLVATVAGVTALLLGLGAAIYMSEYAPDPARRTGQ